MILKKWPLLALCSLFSGCLSMSEKEKTENLSGPADVSGSIATGIDSGFLSVGEWPKDNWWESFNSPVLNKWIEEGFAQNPSLRALENRVESARQKSKVVESKLFPFLFFDADDSITYFSKNGLTHSFNPSLPLHGYQADLSLSFSYEFDFWSKYRNLFRAAFGEMLAEKAEYEQAKLILSTSLVQSYFALVINEKKADLYKKLVTVAENRALLRNKLLEGALSSKLPGLFDEETVNEARQNLLSIEDEIRTEKHLVNILLGKGPDADLCLDLSCPASLEVLQIPDNVSLDLIARRPDIAARIRRMEALAAQVSAAKADFFPSVNLNAFAGLQSLSFSNLFSLGSKTGTVDPAIHLPIFVGGAIKANLREKKALFDQSVFDYNALLLQSVQEVADIISGIRATFTQKKLQENSVEAAVQRLYLTELRKEGGLDSLFSVLDLEEEKLNQSIKDLNLLYTQYAFAVKLIKSLGGGYRYEP